jgi:uncharacterized membrane protein
VWWTVVAVALFLIAHNFCLSLLPRVEIPLAPEAMTVEPGGRAVAVPFDHSPGDTLLNPRSRVILTENGTPLLIKFRAPGLVRTQADGSWCHVPGRIIFSTPDGTDPRKNGRRYVVHSPMLYARPVGYGAIAALCGAGLMLRRGTAAGRTKDGAKSKTEAPAPLRAPWPRALRMSAVVAGLVFLGGLYCATGTLAPYANTMLPHPDPATGYLYNIDHEILRASFSFVDGQPRATWQDSPMLRRILHPVLAWPWMKALGYETGGVCFNFFINLAGFIAGVWMVRRHVGERGAIFAAWLLALYPGAAYWAGQPYFYALIFPLSVAALWLLLELPEARGWRLGGLSLGLGVIYLGYDFHAYYVPASVFLLIWHRRWRAAGVSVAIQLAPLALWLWTLQHVVQVSLETSNTAVYGRLIEAFFNPAGLAASVQRAAGLPEVAADVFFGANFFFLPLLAVAAWALDFRGHDFGRFRAVVVLIVAAGVLFLFCNLPPPHDGPWNLSGSWIARLYQPLFPALVLGLAWWWQALQPHGRRARVVRVALVAGALAGNALVCFGPVAGVKVPVAEAAFYRFYDHTELHWAYERNLRVFGRRPLGFPQPLGAAGEAVGK